MTLNSSLQMNILYAAEAPANKRPRLDDSDDERAATTTTSKSVSLKKLPGDDDEVGVIKHPIGTESDLPTESAAEQTTQTFPQRLMEMLDDEVVPDAMWWAEEGKAFAMDLSKFGDVLQHHFQATKYASFTRKLNKW